jgi:hypothetical protein
VHKRPPKLIRKCTWALVEIPIQSQTLLQCNQLLGMLARVFAHPMGLYFYIDIPDDLLDTIRARIQVQQNLTTLYL